MSVLVFLVQYIFLSFFSVCNDYCPYCESQIMVLKERVGDLEDEMEEIIADVSVLNEKKTFLY